MMIRIDYSNREECHQMDLHKYLTSEKAGYDRGEVALLEWVAKYAKAFREWSNSLPAQCVGCGKCRDATGECPNPYDEARLRIIR